jgi:hypothetical protein
MGPESYGQYLRRMSFAEWLRKLEAQPAEQRFTAAAARVIELWNARQARTSAGPDDRGRCARRAAVAFQCPPCTMIGETDLRGFNRHPHASIQSLISALSCPRCPGGPFMHRSPDPRVATPGPLPTCSASFACKMDRREVRTVGRNFAQCSFTVPAEPIDDSGPN